MKDLINVLLTPVDFAASLGDECIKQVRAVSPRIKVTDVTDLVNAEQRGDSVARERLNALLAEAEVICGFRLPKNIIARAPKLKWFQSLLAGVNHVLEDQDIVQSPVVITNWPHGNPVSEFAIHLMLMLAKKAPKSFHSKQEKKWEPFRATLLHDKTVGILGLGSIGREVARLCKAFGMRVIATRRSAKQAGQAKDVDLLLPPDRLREVLAESDFVVISLPLIPETYKLIGEAELRSMKHTAYLINIARGGILDEEALIRAIDEAWIAGAALDALSTEPLPSESRLWELPDVIITPHMSGRYDHYNRDAIHFFNENLERYLEGRELVHVVDKKMGY